MNRSKKRFYRNLLAALVLVTGMTMSATPRSFDPPLLQGVKITPIGTPTWKPVDFHLFSAPVGTADSGYVEFFNTTLSLLPPPNHLPHPALGVGPGAPHQPPYDSEFAANVAALGYQDAVRFNRSQFSNGNGVYLVWMNVPFPGTTGSSPDFASGPIIPNSLFPIHVSAVDVHNGKLFSNAADFDTPALDTIDPPFFVDGHSHFPVFIADNADFGPAGANLLGSYDYRIVMTDSSGNGWLIRAHFEVAP